MLIKQPAKKTLIGAALDVVPLRSTTPETFSVLSAEKNFYLFEFVKSEAPDIFFNAVDSG